MWAREEECDQGLPRGFPKNSCVGASGKQGLDSIMSLSIHPIIYCTLPLWQALRIGRWTRTGLPSRTLRAFQWGRQPDKQMLGYEPGAVTCNSYLTNTYMSVHQGYRGWTVKQTNYSPWTSGHFIYTPTPSPDQASITLGKAEWVVQNPKLCLCLHLSFCSFLWIKLRVLALKCAYEQRYQAVHANLCAPSIMGRLICIQRFLTVFIP